MPVRIVSKSKNGVQPVAGESVVYIGRPSALGNPFAMKNESDREKVVAQYRVWLREQYLLKGAAHGELQRLAERARSGESLALQCWCAPRACHGDVVKEAIDGINRKIEAAQRG